MSDTVDCDTGPESCGRYIVLRPVGESEPALHAQMNTFMVTKIGWKIEPQLSGTPKYGSVYRGPTSDDGNDYGGYLNAASAQYAAWQREHFTRGIHPPVRAELAAQRAMRDTPDGVFIEINGSTCGSVTHCQGG